MNHKSKPDCVKLSYIWYNVRSLQTDNLGRSIWLGNSEAKYGLL